MARRKRRPRAGIGCLGEGDLLAERGVIGMGQVEMPQAMTSDLKQRIGDQLLRALGVRLHPFAAGEESRFDAFGAQKIDDAAVIAGHVTVLLAKIEGERDQLLVRRQLDAADRSAERRRDPNCRGEGHLLKRRKVERPVVRHMLELGLGAGQRCRCPALLRRERLLGQGGRAAGKRQENHGNDGNPTHRSSPVLPARPRGCGGSMTGPCGHLPCQLAKLRCRQAGKIFSFQQPSVGCWRLMRAYVKA